DHPQYRFVRLLASLGLGPADVRPWPAGAPPDPARNRVISLALRPAPVTDRWLAEGPGLPPLEAAMARVTLIEAPSPRAEATAIALALREAAAAGKVAALLTPDRGLTRQVAAALDRWGIVPDDSGGQPLALSAPGRFLRLVAALAAGRATAEGLLALLKHPLAASAGDQAGGRGPHLLALRDLERALRRDGPPFPTPASLRAWAAGGDTARAVWAGWVAGVLAEAAALAEGGSVPLPRAVAAFRRLAERVAAGPAGTGAGRLWADADGAEALAAVTMLADLAHHGGPLTAPTFADLLARVLAAHEVRDAVVPDPRIRIQGTLEARLQDADLVVLGGLNEGAWPALPPADPWLNRAMRHQAGLLLPERRIGLAAHDFQIAAAAPSVILSRALRDADAETTPARWVNRLTNLLAGLPGNGGPAALDAMRSRGAVWLVRAAAIEAPAARIPRAARPAPRPPVAARPRQLAVTRIATLIRDPYAVYARSILRLYPLDPLRAEPDARLRGSVLHRVL
ncbi:MAG: double-strand break repair protein AddB, partial [Gemmobacter sp.]